MQNTDDLWLELSITDGVKTSRAPVTWKQMDYAIQGVFLKVHKLRNKLLKSTHIKSYQINSSQPLRTAVQTSAFYSLSPCTYTTEVHKDK